jgi:tellurite resistance protein
LISVNSRYAAVAGGIAGVAITANQLTSIASMGLTATLWLGSIGVEMVYLSWLQIRLIADLAVVYDLQLDADDPEDILMIFGYALGVSPTEFLGKGIQIAAGATTRQVIKTTISKGTLKTIQNFARQLGFKILQRTIIKYAVPAVSAAVGSGYNYVTTRSIGSIAKSHFRNRGKASEELRFLVTRQYTYDLIFPAAILYMAQVDGDFNQAERDLYKSILSRMTFDEHNPKDIQKLIDSETNILSAIRELEDETAPETIFELLTLMAIYDGKLTDEERSFLVTVADTLGIEIDMDALEVRATTYRVDSSNKAWNKVINATSSSLGAVKNRVAKLKANWRKQKPDKADDNV